MYTPNLGVWMQRDPDGAVDGLNLYAYVGDNPTDRVDPTGEFALYYHMMWGRDEMQTQGYSRSAVGTVLRNNMLTDMISVWSSTPVLRQSLQDQWHLSEDQMAALEKQYAAMHFDNLKDSEAIQARWKDFHAAMEKEFKCKCDPPAMLAKLGQYLHAAQDFYSHSNWAEIAAQYGYTEKNIPTYQDWQDGKTKIPLPSATTQTSQPAIDLYTGSWPSVGDRGHDKINHDSPYDVDKYPGHANFAMAAAAAKAATKQIIAEFENMVGGECLKRMKAYQLTPAEMNDLENSVRAIMAAASAANQYTGNRDADMEHFKTGK